MLLSDDDFAGAFRSFTRSAFRLEVQDAYAIGQERQDFERFLAGRPVPPSECDWLRPWLDRLARWTREGKTVSRIRVLAEPTTDYQRWLLWGEPWMARAGEDNRYVRRSTAQRIGLPLADDWWLFDDARVIEMRFTGQGEVHSRTLVTDAAVVARYCAWRDTAMQNSTTAEGIAAA